MICVSLQHKNLEQLFEILSREVVRMAEVRLDRCNLSIEEIEELFASSDVPLVATCRLSECKDAEDRLSAAIRAGAKYADLEIEAPPQMGKRLRRLAHECGTIFIRSFHDFKGTPTYEYLEQMVSQCQRFGGEVVKIVTTAVSDQDAETVLRLYDYDREGKLIAFCMGDRGRQSRLECLSKGAPFTYASPDGISVTAGGQWSLDEMNNSLYKGFSFFDRMSVSLPASKSFAQRAIIAAALAEGRTVLHGFTDCGDSLSAIDAAGAIGAKVKRIGDVLEITGIAGRRISSNSVNSGQSGLLARMLIPILALNNEDTILIEGEGTLVNRPLENANDIMAAFGVTLSNVGRTSKEIHIPLEINGHLLPGRAEISGKGGSQLITGLLMALPMADKPSTIFVVDPKSIPYMFITMDILRKYGIDIVNEMEGGDDFLETQDWTYCTGMTFHIKGGQKYRSTTFELEKDWSSAANLMVAAAIFGSVSIQGLDTSSLQADLSIMDILVEAGASISQDDDGSSTGAINVSKAPLNAFIVDLGNAPDLFPIVSVLAAFCPGTSRIGGVGRLVTKESNRAEGIVEMLAGMGVEVTISGDEMVIVGHSLENRLATGRLLHGGQFSSKHDHRMVMAMKVAALGSSSPVVIDDEDCVSKSFPEFLTIINTK